MQNENISNSRGNTKVKDLVITSLLIALVFVATSIIKFTLPISLNGGLIHFGTGMMFISVFVFGGKKGAIAGAVGMALFDVTAGWGTWAPYTFVIKGVMALIVGAIAYSGGKNANSKITNIIAIIFGGLWMLVASYATEVILYGNLYAPVSSILGNVIQITVGAIISIPVAAQIKKVGRF